MKYFIFVCFFFTNEQIGLEVRFNSQTLVTSFTFSPPPHCCYELKPLETEMLFEPSGVPVACPRDVFLDH